MTLQTVSPEKACQMLSDGAILVDIREADEHARERIAAARHLPLSKLEEADAELHRGKPVIFHCRSGHRTLANSLRLEAYAGQDCEAFVVEGGLDAWRKAGLPVVTDRRQPLEIQRQVQIAAGGMGLAGVLLGVFVSPGFFIVPGFIGAGLLFAGLTGTCGMARVLKFAPWNRGIMRSA
ncbi:rhodanese family protein [Bradyrhizobium sp. G127]|uniref:rhodanese family protein n=1 Tax=Bradyrhizobium sp. G127 TaxID=2904800 RepID=UPI001F1EFDD0|nr:rhodanese family protein [Bradyrhizobium sp. G127]MCF2525065.1 rhodanese family protein [Bradyrhizobium sp. G127]